MMVSLYYVIQEMHSFSMRPAKYFYDKPLPKYLDPKTVLIYRPHPVIQMLMKLLSTRQVCVGSCQKCGGVGDGAPHHHHPPHHLEVGLSRRDTHINKRSCGSGLIESGSGYGSGSSISNKSGSDTAEEKKYRRKFCYNFFLIKNCNLLIPWPP
jgi:hypothetical protein